jgi:tetratricopeptide (TPR) repeat protein
MELAVHLRRRGWIADIAARDEGFANLRSTVPHILEAGYPVFIAIDYAEAEVRWLEQLLSHLARVDTRRLRVLLVTRGLGKWWNDVALSRSVRYVVDPRPVQLADVSATSARNFLLQSYRDFRRELLGERRDEFDVPLVLSKKVGTRTRPLEIQAAALSWVLGQMEGAAFELDDPLLELIVHERNYWRRALEGQSGVTFAVGSRLLDRFLMIPTLVDATSSAEALSIVSRIPSDSELPNIDLDAVTRVLAQLYPGREGHYWSPMVPDRLGETLVTEVLTNSLDDAASFEEFSRLLGDVRHDQAAQSVTVLVRAAGLVDGVEVSSRVFRRALGVVERLLMANSSTYLPAIIEVAGAVREPAALIELARRALRHASRSTLDRAVRRLPKVDTDLLELAVEVEAQRIERIKGDRLSQMLRSTDVSDDLRKSEKRAMADALHNLAFRLAGARRPERALRAAAEAYQLRLELAQQENVSRLADLARSPEEIGLVRALNNLGSRLSDVGDVADALEKTRIATETCRRHAVLAPELWLPELVMSLNNHGRQLVSRGLMDQALETFAEAAELSCGLAAVDPAQWLTDLVVLLNNLSALLRSSGRYSDALAVSEYAVHICRKQAEEPRTAWLPDLAASLNNFGVHLASAGLFGEALSAATEAAQIFESLAGKNPSVWSRDLAMVTSNLSVRLSEAGHVRYALDRMTAALSIREGTALSDNPTMLRDLARLHVNLSNRLREVGRDEEALASAERAIEILVGLGESYAFPSDIPLALVALALCQSDVGRQLDAIRSCENALRNFTSTSYTQIGGQALSAAIQLRLGHLLGKVLRLDDATFLAWRSREAYEGIATNSGTVLLERVESSRVLASLLFAAGCYDDAWEVGVEAIGLAAQAGRE